ncbi:hypothetical protein KKG65_00555 [Patescibacteria group bacterium]|nr:hypothetical protein [Patescibacteria group bacterium]
MKTEKGIENPRLAFITQHKYLGELEEVGVPVPLLLDKIFRDRTVGGLSHLGAAILCSQARREGFEVDFFNANDLIQHPDLRRELVTSIRDNPGILSCLSAMDINSGFISSLAGSLPPERTIVGGVGPTYAPELYSGEYAKAFGHMEGKRFSEILENFRTGTPLDPVYMTENPKFSDNLEDYPELDPTVSLLTDSNWLTSLFAPIEVGRGCHYSCDFCHTGRHIEKIRVKPLGIIDAQLKMFRDHVKLKWPFIVVYDQNLVTPYILPQYGREYLLDLMSLFEKYNFYWAGEGTLGDIVEQDDRELLKKMGERCLSILVGAENLLGDMEGSDGKNRLNANFETYVRTLKECKVPVMWSIIGGLDNQAVDYYPKMVETVRRLALPAIIHKAVARPGTSFYTDVRDEGRVLSDKASDRDMKFHMAHKPKSMSADDALGGHAFAHAQIFNPVEIAKRFCQHWKDVDFGYAVKSLTPEFHGAVITPRIVHTYRNELKQFRKKLKNIE